MVIWAARNCGNVSRFSARNSMTKFESLRSCLRADMPKSSRVSQIRAFLYGHPLLQRLVLIYLE